MTKDSFNIGRCASLTRLYITENRRFILLSLASVFGVLLLIALFSILDTNYMVVRKHGTAVGFDPALQGLEMSYIIAAFILGALGCASSFAILQKKQGRINLLMIPANASEKLASRVIIFVILFPVMYLLLVCAAESIRCLIVSCTEHVVEPMPLYVALFKPEVSKFLIPSFKHGLIVMMVTMGFFMVMSFFVLGSTIWPKASAIKTFAVFAALTFFYIGTAAWLTSTLSKGFTYYSQSSWLERNCVEVSIAAEVIAILFNLAMAWMRLRETDVITTRR